MNLREHYKRLRAIGGKYESFDNLGSLGVSNLFVLLVVEKRKNNGQEIPSAKVETTSLFSKIADRLN